MALAAAAAPLLLYAFSLSDAVMLEDDGLFLMVGADLGIAHPPGYPLYTLLLHLFMQLPFGTPALMGHFSSAVFGALACGALYFCVRLTGVAPIAALAAAWLLGAQEHVWSQAVRAEVYSLNLLLLFSIHAFALLAARDPQRRGPWFAAAVCYGFGLANHWPLMVLATPGLALLAWPALKAAPRRLPSAAALGAASAALPYAWMVWRSHRDIAVSFLEPIGTLEAFWRYVSRASYANADSSPTADWSDRLGFLQWFGEQTLAAFTLAGFALAVLGLAALLGATSWRRRLEAWAGIAVWASQSVLLILLLDRDYDYWEVGIFRPYSLVCYGLMAIWAAVGLHVLAQLLGRRFAPLARPAVLQASQGAAGLALAAAVAFGNWSANDHSGDRLTRAYADMVFEQLPQDALVTVTADANSTIFGYYHLVAGEREDVLLLNTQGLAFTNRLYSPDLSSERRREILADYLSGTDRRAFSLPGDGIPKCGPCGRRRDGLLVEVLPKEPERLTIDRSVASDRYFRWLLETPQSDPWAYFARSEHLRRYGVYLAAALRYGDADLVDGVEPLVTLAEQDFHGMLGMLEGVLSKQWDGRFGDRAWHWVVRMRALESGIRQRKKERAEFRYLEGALRANAGDRDGAVALFRESLAIYDHSANQAHDLLEQMGVPSGK